MYTETILGQTPSKSNSYRIIKVAGHGSMAKADSLKKYEQAFYMQCKNRGVMISSYFDIHVDVFYPSNRSDLDNAMKIILDCLQACKVIKNDNLCTGIVARKFIDKNNPRVEIKLIVV